MHMCGPSANCSCHSEAAAVTMEPGGVVLQGDSGHVANLGGCV